MDFDEVLDRLEKLGRPALRLVKSDPGGTRSKFGGSPSLPKGMEWPSWKGTALAFLAQIDLSELPRPIPLEDWPSDGMLYFFYHPEQETWGFDPNDRGSWRVLYSPGPATQTLVVLKTESVFPEFALRFEPLHSLPDILRLGLSSEEAADEILDRADELKLLPFDGAPQHQIGGYPNAVQNDDMELECQLASNGVYCGGGGLEPDPRVAELEGGAGEWKLLLQIDTDEDADMMWGDAGMLYFWIRTQDLKNRDFSNVWMVLQCG